MTFLFIFEHTLSFKEYVITKFSKRHARESIIKKRFYINTLDILTTWAKISTKSLCVTPDYFKHLIHLILFKIKSILLYM